MDLNWKLHECRKMYGIWGSFVSWWFDGFFEMTRFALGRLQFELMDFPESYEKTGHVRPEGMTKVINMHIPSCGPLKKADCEASFRQAAAFFADAFPGEKIAFFCESWLLYPRHREFLSPDSTGNMMETRKPCRRKLRSSAATRNCCFRADMPDTEREFSSEKRKKCCKRWCTGTGKVRAL